jgi:hypothetical protein
VNIAPLSPLWHLSSLRRHWISVSVDLGCFGYDRYFIEVIVAGSKAWGLLGQRAGTGGCWLSFADIHNKELLAIINGLNKWDTYCKSIGHTITILSDHKNLEYWQTKKDLNLRQACWGEQLMNYNFTIIY